MGYVGNEPAKKYTSLQRQTFSSPTGSSFVLNYSVTNSDSILLYVNSVKQDPASYSATGTSLTLTESLVSGDEMYALFYGRATETVSPPDNSVGLAELSASGTASSSTFLRGDNSWVTPTSGADTDLSNLSATGENKVCQAWVNFNGTGTVAIRDSYNVSSITDNGTGEYNVNFANSVANANYSANYNTRQFVSWSGTTGNSVQVFTTSYIQVIHREAGSKTDTDYNTVTVFGD